MPSYAARSQVGACQLAEKDAILPCSLVNLSCFATTEDYKFPRTNMSDSAMGLPTLVYMCRLPDPHVLLYANA